MEDWKNNRKQAPPGGPSAPNARRTERLVAELRANLVKRKAAVRNSEAAPQNQAFSKVQSKPDGV